MWRFLQETFAFSAAVEKALQGIDVVHHLAYVNGTANFYKMPERVLEIAVKGIINVLDGCLRCQVGELYLASSSEVYQQPPRIPTDENVPLIIPDVMNPRVWVRWRQDHKRTPCYQLWTKVA